MRGIRTVAVAAAVQRQVQALEPALPVYDVKMMDEWLHESVTQPRFTMVLLAAFGAVALLLAAVGIASPPLG